jgi:MoaA/NifB/PqqE/SkfB family radical SAM enzyme
MVIKVAMLIRKYFPDAVYRHAQVLYRSLKQPIIKKMIIDSPFLSKLFKNKTYPDELFIFLTTRCNIRCLICRREDHKPKDLDFENIYKLKEPIKHAQIVDLTGWGEPFLYTKFYDVLAYILNNAKKQNIIRLITNGTLLNEEYGKLLNRRIYSLAISLNAATKTTYNRDMQLSDFDNVIGNIKNFISVLDVETISKINLHFVAHAKNYVEIPDFVLLAHSLGIQNVTIGNYIISTEDHIHLSLLHDKIKYNDSIALAERISIDKGIYLNAKKFNDGSDPENSSIKCFYPYTQLFVQPDGEVSGPCCYAGSYYMGNLYTDGFKAVWMSEKYKKLRLKRHLPACRTCAAYSSFDSLNTHFDSTFLRTNREIIEKRIRGEAK